MNPSLLLAFLASGLLAIAAWARLTELYRASSIGRAAAAQGWRYAAYATGFVTSGLRGLPLFKVGGGIARNLVTDNQITLFDHVWGAGGGARHTAGSFRAVGAAQVRGVPVFRLEFKQPGVFGLASSGEVSGDEIEVFGRPVFADSYRVFGDDHAAVHALLDDRVVAFLVANPGWCVECDGRWLIAYGAYDHLDPRRLGAQFAAFREVIALFSRTAKTQ